MVVARAQSLTMMTLSAGIIALTTTDHVAKRCLNFRGSIVAGSPEHEQLQQWLSAGLAHRGIWAKCASMPNITGKPSSHVILAVRNNSPTQCSHCDTDCYPSHSHGKFCSWDCGHKHRYKSGGNAHRGLGQRRRGGAKRVAAVGPLTDFHLITDRGVRATVGVRGSIDAWLNAENSLRLRNGLDTYRLAD